MTKKQIILLCVGAVLLIIITLFVSNIFSHKSGPDKQLLNQVIQLTEERKAADDRTISTQQDFIKVILDDKKVHETNDSLLRIAFIQNQQFYIQSNQKYQAIDAKLKNIPTDIARIAHNDDSIRAAFSR